jgi:hypothetical protein
MNRMSKRKKRRMANNNPTSTKDGDKPAESNTQKANNTGSVGPEAPVTNEHREEPAKQQTIWRRVSHYFREHAVALASLVVALASLVFSGLAVLNARKQADIAEKGLVDVQRAFIVVSGLKEEPVRINDKITGFKFTPIIRNSGNTPAKQVRWVTLDPFNAVFIPQFREFCRDENPMDPDQILNQPEKSPAIHVGRGILGPQDALLLAPEFTIDNRAFQDILDGQRLGKFYFGAIRYFDQFSKNERVTKYCYTISSFSDADGFEATGPGLKAPSVHPFPAVCKHWNCADEDCDSDKKRYDEEKMRPQPAK